MSDYLRRYMADYVTGRLKNAKHYEGYEKRWAETLRGKLLTEVVPADIAGTLPADSTVMKWHLRP